MWSLLLLAFASDVEWAAYGANPGGTRYSPASQVNKGNVDRLTIAWRYKTRGLHQPKKGRPSALETTPLYVDGTLYLTSALGRVAALDPATGAERWSYDPKIDPDRGYGDFTNRGVSFYRKGAKRYILGVTIEANLFALDAKTGQKLWERSLREGLRNPPRSFEEYEQTSPPCVIGDVVVAGSAVADNGSTRVASGEVRGFEVHTGKLLWTWDPIPGEGPRAGGANAWSVIAADERLGLVYVPTGSPSPDYYGGERKAVDHGNSVVALEARTGKLRWAFQTVHHDLWDYDVASPPLLLTVKGRGAVAVGSKTGHIFLLDRKTGEPIFGVEERPVPKSDAEGEQAALTQPFPVKPRSLVPHTVVPWGPDEESRRWCADAIAKLRNEGIFTPPSEQGTLAVPGNVGGLHWGGFAYDPANRLLIAPANSFPAIVRLIRRDKFDGERRSDRLGFEFAPQQGTPYGMARNIFLSPKGMPCSAPPWGTLSAIDTNTGDLKWQVPFGDIPGASSQPQPAGFLNLGGPIVTGGGLIFIGAAMDGYFRAFDVSNGIEVWKTKLPASARSTPMTYVHKGRQYVAISAGGHVERFGPLGDEVIAYALPGNAAAQSETASSPGTIGRVRGSRPR